MGKKYGEKRDLILQAAKEIFAEQGYHSSSISSIAQKANIGDGTVYLYFKNKEDILRTLFHETIYNQFVPRLEKELIYYQDPRFRMFYLIHSHFLFFGSDYPLARVIQIESRQTSPAVREAMKLGIKRYFQLIESIVEQGQNNGQFRTDVSAKNCRKLIFGSLDEIATCWVLAKEKYSLMEMVEPAAKMILAALQRYPEMDPLSTYLKETSVSQ